MVSRSIGPGIDGSNGMARQLYLYGHGVLQDSRQAASLIQAAAKAEDPVGLRFLGLMYEGGVGLPRDYPRAIELFLQAAAKRDANSYFRLAICYQRGTGTAPDPAKALSLLEEAVRLGNPPPSTNSVKCT